MFLLLRILYSVMFKYFKSLVSPLIQNPCVLMALSAFEILYLEQLHKIKPLNQGNDEAYLHYLLTANVGKSRHSGQKNCISVTCAISNLIFYILIFHFAPFFWFNCRLPSELGGGRYKLTSSISTEVMHTRQVYELENLLVAPLICRMFM